ncbi:MAG: hypothetical protein QM757_22180 [Paludibaculum sp.]
MVALRFRILLVVAALLAFCGALGAPFQFDDFSLLNDPALNSPNGWSHAFTATQTRPLTFLSFWLNLRFSEAPWTFHLVSLVLHLLCVWLASGLLMELLPVRAAWLAGAVFAFHPLQTEAVAYVFSRATLLAALFCCSPWPAGCVNDGGGRSDSSFAGYWPRRRLPRFRCFWRCWSGPRGGAGRRWLLLPRCARRRWPRV